MGYKLKPKPTVHITPGLYYGHLVNFEEQSGQYGDTFEVKGKILSGSEAGTIIAGFFHPDVTPRTKMGRLIKELLGKEALENEVDTDHLCFVECWLVVEDHMPKDAEEPVSKLTGVKKIERKQPEPPPAKPGPPGTPPTGTPPGGKPGGTGGVGG